MSFRFAALGIATLAVLAAVVAAATSQADSSLSVKVSAVTVPVANLAASQTPATVACPAGTTLVGGGLRAYFAGTILPGDPYHPINGLVLRGLGTSSASGNLSATGATDPSNWTAYGGFAGQNEPNDNVTAFGMCTTGGPGHTQIVVTTVNGPSDAQTTQAAIATCPSGTRLVGGGAIVNPSSEPSVKPDGSYPSDSSGARAGINTDPDSWVAIGESGGLMSTAGGSGAVTTTALAVCSTDATLQTTIVRASDIDHPAGPGNGNPGTDPIATVTATCPSGTTLLDGGALTTGNAAGDDGGNIQQGVHLRGSYPSDGSANAVGDGATNPSSWSAIVQSGGQATPGTDSFAYALCAQAAPSGGASPGAGAGGSGGGAGSASGSTTGSGSATGTGSGPASFTPTAGAPSAKHATVKPGKAGSLALSSGSSAITLAWSKSGLGRSAVVLTGQLTPALVSGAGGAASGSSALQVTAKRSSGGTIGTFGAPLDIRFPGAAGNVVPAFGTNGRTWAGVPLLKGTKLPRGSEDGYYRDRLGTLHILTLNPAFFGLVNPATKLSNKLNLKLSVTGTLNLAASHTLWLTVGTTRPAAITVQLARGAQKVSAWRSSTGTAAKTFPLTLPLAALRAGSYKLTVVAVSGSYRASRTATVSFVTIAG